MDVFYYSENFSAGSRGKREIAEGHCGKPTVDSQQRRDATSRRRGRGNRDHDHGEYEENVGQSAKTQRNGSKNGFCTFFRRYEKNFTVLCSRSI